MAHVNYSRIAPLKDELIQPYTKDGVVKVFTDLYHELKKLAKHKTLEPTLEMNTLLEVLVHRCIATYSDDIVNEALKDKKIINLQVKLPKLFSKTEFLLEKYWALAITEKDIVAPYIETKKEFPYRKNYQDLARLEFAILNAFINRIERMVFIGSGPLPFTSTEIAKLYPDGTMQIDNVDMSAEANFLAEQVVDQMNLKPIFKFYTEDAISFEYYSKSDVLFFAALVGETIVQKKMILTKIAKEMAPDSLILVRTAHAFRTLLYPAISDEDLRQCGLVVEVTVDPYTDVVNSFVIAKKN